jgi:predicted hotdog family 3-hydroxylacyl-ACP dehydratase
MSTIDRDAILALIPHAGSMCLLDSVVGWTAETIHARSDSHRDPANPLRRNDRLAALHLIEYAAQAMAVHGGLSAQAAGARAAPGMLVSARAVKLQVDRLDDLAAPLEVHARRLVASGGGWLYGFEIDCGAQRLAEGRVAVLPIAAS